LKLEIQTGINQNFWVLESFNLAL